MFDLNRRKFLIASIITGAAISDAELVFAEDRYQVLVKLQHDAIEAASVYNDLKAKSGRLVTHRSREDSALIEASGAGEKLEILLNYLFSEFNRSDLHDPSIKARARMFVDYPETINTLNEEELRRVEDVIVTLAVIKNMMIIHRAPIDDSTLEKFGRTCGVLFG